MGWAYGVDLGVGLWGRPRGRHRGKPRARPRVTLMRYKRCSSPWLSWAGLGLIGLGCIELGCLCCSRLRWSVLTCAWGRGGAGLDWVGLCSADLC